MMDKTVCHNERQMNGEDRLGCTKEDRLACPKTALPDTLSPTNVFSEEQAMSGNTKKTLFVCCNPIKKQVTTFSAILTCILVRNLRKFLPATDIFLIALLVKP